MHIFITGATGFLGTALISYWLQQGHRISAFVRSRSKADKLFSGRVTLYSKWEDISSDTAIDAVVNLAGAPIAGGFWTEAYKKILLQSRIETTSHLVGMIKNLTTKPEVMISGSAAGYYGRQSNTLLDETEGPQDIFMSRLCRLWECAAQPVITTGVRLVTPRISLVLGQKGGAFPPLVRPIKYGVGAVMGSGQQYFPWIHLEDLVRMFDYMLKEKAVSGVYNCVAPENVTQKDFTKTVARHLNRPIFFKVPGWLFRKTIRDMADLFIEGQRMSAEKITDAGFRFRYPTLTSAVENLLPK